MRRREFASALALLPVAVRAAPAPSTLIDRMPAFWPAYEAGTGLPPPERAALLMRDFFAPYAADYRRAGVKPSAERVARWLAGFDPIADDVRALGGEFAASYRQHVVEFRLALPDFDAAASPVALLPSLFTFDAHLEPDGAQLPLFFGPDGIVRFHGRGADLGVLFAHELFHCYQAQKNPALSLEPQPPVFAALWIEGVATYASERLNEGAELLRVLLDDRQLAATDQATLRRVATALLAQLDDRSDATLNAFFSMGHTGTDWPARAGYYVGLLAARRIGASMALPQMAALASARVRELLGYELAALAAGSR